MLNLPQSTELRRPLPKAQIYKKFELKSSQRDAFDADVAKMEIVNAILPTTLAAVAEGNEVKGIFVVDVELKSRHYEPKNIALIAKLIPQRIVFVLRYDTRAQLAVYHTQLFTTPWISLDEATITLAGLNLDSVWGNIVSSIGSFEVETENTLEEQIKVNEQQAKLNRQIETLTRQMNAAKQPRRKRELFDQIKKLKGGI